MLVLNAEEILKVVDHQEILKAIEEAYTIYDRDAYYMPDRFHVDFKNKTLLYMPCFVDQAFGTKSLTVFPENVKKGIPAIDGIMMLNDYESGAPKSIMDGKILTSLRTGAVGGIGIKYTTPESVEALGLIGAGAQGFYQVLYACQVRNFKRVYVYDAFAKNLDAFIVRLQPHIGSDIEIIACSSTTELLKHSEVIITATTAQEPVLPNDETLLKGKHFIGIGSYKPTMQEYPDALFPLLKTVHIDADIALEETGDLIHRLESGLLKENQVRRISDFIRLASDTEKKQLAEQTTLFKSVGMALFDLIVAEKIYQLALHAGIGYQL